MNTLLTILAIIGILVGLALMVGLIFKAMQWAVKLWKALGNKTDGEH